MSTAITCLSCHSLSTLIFNDIISKDSMSVAFQEVCIALHMSTPRVCTGIIEQMADHIDFVRENSKLKSTEICGILLGSQCFIGRSENLYWKLDIPPKSQQFMSNLPLIKSMKNPSDKRLTILHLTDIHLDLDYLSGSDSKCDEPLCCRNPKSNQNDSAGRWGAYPCDIPFETVNHSLQQISEKSGYIDIWYWTGDIVAHDIWQYSRETTFKYSHLITQLLRKYSADKLVIPVIGNHETVPVNWFGFPLNYLTFRPN